MNDTSHEERWMARAIELAVLGVPTVAPNPAVGAVVVADGLMIGEGYHRKAGGPHAEVIALEAAGDKARGACLYVTLEPCSSWGRTPPCVDAIAAAGITTVVVGTLDPNPRHAGRGLTILRRLGIAVVEGVLEAECIDLNPDFNRRMREGPEGIQMIWSGGQTGVDRAALDWAIENHIPHGGWCPKGRSAEDGIIPGHYHLRETPQEDYEERARWNVEDSDVTLIIVSRLPVAGGTALTEECAREANKPVLVLRADQGMEECRHRFEEWIRRHRPCVLNVAGPRASESAEIGTRVGDVLDSLLL